MSADPDLDQLLPRGTTLGGKYLIGEVLGQGGMGVVVAARHLRLQRDVALKVLLPSLRADPDVVARFEREGRSASQLLNRHVARVLDVDALPDGTPFIVMERLRGRDLNDVLIDRGPLPYREAVGYLLEACAGMVDAHKAGIVHRDLKPNNLFLDEQGERPVLKILDFGISKITGDENKSMTATSTAFGTPLYMSPEQVRSTKHVDQRADIWSLGIVLYELLCGETPFNAPAAPAIIAAIIADKPPPVGERRPDLPSDLAAVVMRALAKDPNERFPDVNAFAAALAPFGPTGASIVPPALAAAPLPAAASASTHMPLAQATTPPPVQRPLIPIVVGMALAFVVGSVLLVFALRKKPETPALAERPVASVASVAPSTAPEVAPSATVAVATATPSVAPSSEPTASTRPRPAPDKPSPGKLAAPDKPAPDKPAPGKPPPVVTPAPDKPAPPKPPPPDDPKYL
jgi:eukaryotic-like serine/threonine-protein kinase